MVLAILVYAFCLLVGLAALGTCAWVVATGQLLTMDGLLIIAVSLTVAAFFAGNLAWAVYTGEVRDLIRQCRSRPKQPEPSQDTSDEKKP